ncbi:MAG: DUF1549 domain-containing protein, partial [Planctomycetaceae bacterium]
MFARRLFGLSATATVILGAAVWIAAPVYSVEHADSPKTAVKNAAEPPRFKPADIAFFKKKVKPLLEARCFKCHGPKSKKLKGGLRLDSRAAVLKGGETGPAAVPGKPKKSLLIEAINYDDLEMPPRTKLPKGEIAILTKWVQMGMPFSKEPQTPGVSKTPGAFPLEERKRSHWAWQPARKRSLPKVKNEKWAVTAIDRFILAKLEAKDIAPAAPADRRTLIRRAYFDLIGLPPTPADVAAFVDDSQPTRTAFATVVDRLLKSPRFGERWGRHWLDLVRYADTLGHEFDYPLRHAHQYRDYVIRAFNADVPYDRFVTEHIAGDLMPDPRRHPELGYNESVIGTGFWFLGEDKHSPVDVKGEEASKIDNQLDVFSKTFLGLTVACARCHDHKFDAITTKDYYALSGFLQSSRRDTALLDPRGVIGHGTRRLRKLLQQANQKLRGNLTDSSKKRAADVAGMLLASQRVLRGKAGKRPEVLKRAATAYGVEERRLATFVRALESKDVDRTAHPLWAWKQLVATRDRHLPKRIAALRQRFERADASFRSTRDKSKPFADFNGRDFGGWMATGFAFGNAPTQPLEWDPASKQTNHLVRAGVAHSGRFSGRLAGVLRSPTFTLTHDQILYRVRGRGRIRLIIDGYVMDEFNGLLFQGASMKVNSRDRWRWLRQGGDIHRYKGHRAHIEIIDDGHDWIAVDEVRFADRRDPTPPAQPHAVALQLLKDPAVTSLKSLAARLAAILTDPQQPAGAKRSAAPAIADRKALLNAALQSGLLTIPKNGLQKLAGEMRKTAAGIPDPMRVIAITDGSPEDEHVFIRG